VDREDRAHHAEIDRKEHADRDQRDFRGFENAEPEDEQRHPGDRGDRPQRLHGRIEQPPRQSPIAGDGAEDGAGNDAEDEASGGSGTWSLISASSVALTSTLASMTRACCSARPAARLDSRCAAPMRLWVSSVRSFNCLSTTASGSLVTPIKVFFRSS